MGITKHKIEITLASGMMIASGNDDFLLGGVDTKTVVDAMGTPYIPGSSLKGKLRSLTKKEENYKTQSYFGSGNDKSNDNLSKQSKILFGDLSLFPVDNLDKFEVKFENTIKEQSCTPRTNMRTVAGLTFIGYIICDEEGKDFIDTLLERLLLNFIGGQGSRGYGWIEKIVFDNKTIGMECLVDGE